MAYLHILRDFHQIARTELRIYRMAAFEGMFSAFYKGKQCYMCYNCYMLNLKYIE